MRGPTPKANDVSHIEREFIDGGYKSYDELAAALGCSGSAIANWVNKPDEYPAPLWTVPAVNGLRLQREKDNQASNKLVVAVAPIDKLKTVRSFMDALGIEFKE